MGKIFGTDFTGTGTTLANNSQFFCTTYIVNHKVDFEPERPSHFIFKVKFIRDLYDMNGKFVAYEADATEALALSLRDPISIKTEGSTNVGTSAIAFNDYIGMLTEQILLTWYSMAHNIANDKIGFKEYYAQEGIFYKWAPNEQDKYLGNYRDVY